MFQKPCLFLYLRKKSLYYSLAITALTTISLLLGKKVISFVYDMENVAVALEDRWSQLAPDAAEWWDRVKIKYSEKGRYYHSLNHLNDMFHYYDEYRDDIKARDAVQLAIYFHDVVYDAKAGDSEEKSADMFEEFAGDHLKGKEELVRQVKEFILLTKTHLTEAHQDHTVFGTDDVHYFLDIDMAVLGWPETEYDCYTKGIRQEYIHIPEKQYRIGRATVLKSFLERKNIYATKAFRDKYEMIARTNVEREIKKLEDPSSKIEGLPGVRGEICE